MKQLFWIVTALFVASFASASVGKVAELTHARDNSITIGYSHHTGSMCIHAAFTRNGGGADTAVACYQGSNTIRLTANKLESIIHGGNNELSIFEIIDPMNRKRCVGNAMTRVGHTIADQHGNAALAAAAASLSLQCVSMDR